VTLWLFTSKIYLLAYRWSVP